MWHPPGCAGRTSGRSTPTNLNTSKPIAAIRAARIALAKLTGSRGSRAIIQPNTNHDNSNDTNTDTDRAGSRPAPARCGYPAIPTVVAIGAASASALSARVARMATNDDTIAPRSENLVRMYPCDTVGLLPHFAERDPKIGHPVQADPRRDGQTDDADRRPRIDRRVHHVDHLLPQRTGHRGPDLVVDRGQHFGPARQQESGDAETDHQQGEQREDRVVRQPGREEVALAFVEPVVGAHRVVEPSEPRPQPIEDPWLARFAHDDRLGTSRQEPEPVIDPVDRFCGHVLGPCRAGGQHPLQFGWIRE